MNRTRILIIEDDYAIMRGLRDSFTSKKYDVSFAMDGNEALKIALNNEFDIILLDIMLPNINGFEICSRIRESEIETPIIMLTAKGDEESIVLGLNLGADDYVVKPFSTNQLHARCNAFIRRYKQTHIEFSHFGEFTYNFDAKTLTRNNGEEVKLTRKENAMLAYLIKKEGQALTREKLLNTVWHSSVLTTARSVDRCINTLRKKIEINSRQPHHILSIRDVGYKFNSKR